MTPRRMTFAVTTAVVSVALTGCGGSSDSKSKDSSSGSSASSSSSSAGASAGEVVASPGKEVTLPVAGTKLTVKKTNANAACPAGEKAPTGQRYISYDLAVSTEDPSKAIGLSGDWTAKTPQGEQPIDYLAGDMCQKPADQFPLKFDGKKSFTATKIFLVPDGTTAVKLATVDRESTVTLPLK